MFFDGLASYLIVFGTDTGYMGLNQKKASNGAC